VSRTSWLRSKLIFDSSFQKFQQPLDVVVFATLSLGPFGSRPGPEFERSSAYFRKARQSRLIAELNSEHGGIIQAILVLANVLPAGAASAVGDHRRGCKRLNGLVVLRGARTSRRTTNPAHVSVLWLGLFRGLLQNPLNDFHFVLFTVVVDHEQFPFLDGVFHKSINSKIGGF
jgi:hypothetical protein